MLCFAFAGTKTVQAAPAFQAAGAAVSGVGTVSPAWPAHAVDDIALLFVESTGGQAATLSTPAGFVAVTNSPQSTGAGTTGTRLTVFWARATSTTMATPTVADPGDHVYAQIITYRGAIATGDPWDVTGGGVKNGTVTLTGVTTNVANTRIVQAVTRETDSTAAMFSAQTNANLTGITERSDAGTTSGDGGGFAVWDGVKATAGATGDTTTTVSTASFNTFLTVALKPQGGSAPTFQAAGTAVSGTGVVNPAWPAHATNDIALLFVESRGTQAATLSIPAGFATVAGSPQSTTAGGTGTRLTVFWARATSAAMATPRVADPGDHVYARIITYRGVVSSGNPWDTTAGGVRDAITLTGVTTSVADTLVVQAVSRDNDSTAAAFSSQTNANLTAIAERSDAGTTSGNGGGFAVWDGAFATVGATGDTTVAVSVASVNAFLTIALKKPDFPTVVSINLASPEPTSPATSVDWTVTFSASVTGVDSGDFALVMGGGVSGATITGVAGSGTTWTVTADTGSGAGTLGLDLVDDDSIIDASSKPLGGSGAGNGNFSGAVYTVVAASSGFVFTDSVCAHNIAFGAPGQTCALLNWSPQVAGQNLAGVYITAVNTSGVPTRLHATQVRTRNIQFGLSCHNPVADAGRQATFAAATLPLCQANGATPTTWSSTVVVSFAGGVPSSSVSYTFNYPDVGSVELWMRNSAATTQTGSSGAFVVKPGGFALSAIQQTAVPNLANPGAADASGAAFIKSGEAFSVTVTATLADGLTAAPNYGQETAAEGVILAANLVAPGGGASPALQNAASFGVFSAGVATGTTFAWNEVGIITLTPSVADGNYLGAGDATGAVSGNVGRFFPDHFDTEVTNTCVAGGFTYSGQPFPLKVTAKNSSGGTTTNYSGSFAKTVTLTDANGALGAFSPATLVSGDFTSGVADMTATPSVSFAFTTKLTAPATLKVRGADGEATSGITEGTTPLRSGRLRLSNAFGSEKADLAMPVQAQYWSGTSWILNSADSCTSLLANAFFLIGAKAGTSASAVAIAGGNGTLTLSKPTAVAPPGTSTGSVDVAANLGTTGDDQSCLGTHGGTAANMPWLRAQNGNCAATYDRDPSARATFGLNRTAESRKTVHVRERF